MKIEEMYIGQRVRLINPESFDWSDAPVLIVTSLSVRGVFHEENICVREENSRISNGGIDGFVASEFIPSDTNESETFVEEGKFVWEKINEGSSRSIEFNPPLTITWSSYKGNSTNKKRSTSA